MIIIFKNDHIYDHSNDHIYDHSNDHPNDHTYDHKKSEMKLGAEIMKNNLSIYDKIVEYFENKNRTELQDQFFILDCMKELEKMDDVEVTDTALMFINILLDHTTFDNYNNEGISEELLSNNEKKIIASILLQECVSEGRHND